MTGLAGAFGGDAAVKTALLDRLARHRLAGTLLWGATRWDGDAGTALGVSIAGTDPATYAAAFGYPLALAALLDPLADTGGAGFDPAAFVTDWVAVVRPGADLAPIPTLLMLDMLDDPDLRRLCPGEMAMLAALHRADADGAPRPGVEWRAARAAILAVDPGDDRERRAALDVAEALAWSGGAGRSTLTAMLGAMRHLRAQSRRPEWPQAEEDRAIAQLQALWTDAMPERERGQAIDYRARLTARDPGLAQAFFANLDTTNDAVMQVGRDLAARCIERLRAAGRHG
ncbi:MAG: hypothetical protein DI632_05925 [Sphingomonas hengshuiensis]|uniref:Uncharacterized protein n=2 Tax=Sphingomonas TaxID=13687 RepID=A0A2W5B7D8_9SPHN|nr:MAG: hypothetical protein DI632_05925 [Sphingomonas hengshuiensis]